MDARQELMDLNTRIPHAERGRDVSYLDTILDETLVFKRADGSIVNKSTYLASLKNVENEIESIDQMVTSVEFNGDKDVAIVTAIVIFEGRRSGKVVQGVFRNVRYFRKDVGWRMFLWHNDKLSSAIHCASMTEVDSSYAVNESNEMNGTVYQEKSASLPTPPDLRATTVRFEDGSQTKWHYHEGWQVLIGDTGSGFVEEMDLHPLDLSRGQRVFIPPFIWHRHGAKPGENMSHLAVTLGQTTWDYENKLDKGKDIPVLAG